MKNEFEMVDINELNLKQISSNATRFQRLNAPLSKLSFILNCEEVLRCKIAACNRLHMSKLAPRLRK